MILERKTVGLRIEIFSVGKVVEALNCLSTVIDDDYTHKISTNDEDVVGSRGPVGRLPLISVSQFMQVGSTFFAIVRLRRFPLTHHTHTRAVLPNIAPLTTNHEPTILDIRIRKRVFLTPTDTSCDFRAGIIVFVFDIITVWWGGCHCRVWVSFTRSLLGWRRGLVVGLKGVSTTTRGGRGGCCCCC